MRATLSTVGSNFYIAQISQFSKIFQLRVFATIFQSFAISSVFELDTSSFGFWAFFHVSLGVLFQNWSKFQNLSVLVSQSGGQNIPPPLPHSSAARRAGLAMPTLFIKAGMGHPWVAQEVCHFEQAGWPCQLLNESPQPHKPAAPVCAGLTGRVLVVHVVEAVSRSTLRAFRKINAGGVEGLLLPGSFLSGLLTHSAPHIKQTRTYQRSLLQAQRHTKVTNHWNATI